MPLNEATTAPIVEQWSDALRTPFTGAEQETLRAILVDLSGHVVPHIVMDEALPDARQQQYLSQRAIDRIEDWLTMVAASQRRVFKVDTIRHETSSERPALGLRSARHQEIENLPTIGDGLANDIRRYLTRYPLISEISDLEAIDGIGPARTAALESVAFLERASFGFLSPALWTFILQPNIVNALRVLERTDLSLVYGDQNLLHRRIDQLGESTFERFHAFLEHVSERAELASTPSGGALASEVNRWLDRHELRRHRLQETALADGELLVNGAYVDKAKEHIDAATGSVVLMVFLGTAAAGDGDDPAPRRLVEALEAAVVRGVPDVRVVLDQDDGGEPYGSLFINEALVNRLTQNGVSVKFDSEDTLLHSKVLVVDSSTTIVGSHNWTRAGFNEAHELSVLVVNEALGAGFQKRFDALWNDLP